MRILFTKSESPLSKAIRGITTEPVSHCALQFGNFIIHSNLLGVHIEWADNFRSKCEVVYELDDNKDPLVGITKLSKILKKGEFSFYDFGALLFIGLCLLVRRYLKIPLPKANLWQSTGMYLCTEWVSEYALEPRDSDSMITPYKLYLKLKATGFWRDYVQGQEAT